MLLGWGFAQIHSDPFGQFFKPLPSFWTVFPLSARSFHVTIRELPLAVKATLPSQSESLKCLGFSLFQWCGACQWLAGKGEILAPLPWVKINPEVKLWLQSSPVGLDWSWGLPELSPSLGFVPLPVLSPLPYHFLLGPYLCKSLTQIYDLSHKGIFKKWIRILRRERGILREECSWKKWYLSWSLSNKLSIERWEGRKL